MRLFHHKLYVKCPFDTQPDDGGIEMEDDLKANKPWKVTVSSLFPNDHRVEKVFEGYHTSEEAACDAALHKEAVDHGGSTIATIVKVEHAGEA